MPPKAVFDRIPPVVIGAILGFGGLFLGGVWVLLTLGAFQEPKIIAVTTFPTIHCQGREFVGSLWELRKATERLRNENRLGRVVIIYSTPPTRLRPIKVAAWYGVVLDNPVLMAPNAQTKVIPSRLMICVVFQGVNLYRSLRAWNLANTYLKVKLHSKKIIESQEWFEVLGSVEQDGTMETWFLLK